MIVDGHNDLVLHRLARRADDAPGSRRGARRGLRRRVLRPLRPVAAVARPDGDPVRGAAARSDPARGGCARSRRSSSTRCARCRFSARDLGRRVPRGRVSAIVHMEGAEPIARRPLEPRDVVRAGAALDRARLVAAERVRRGRAVSFPVLAGHGRRPDGGRARARCGMQQTRDPRRPVAPQRAGFWDVARLSDAPLVATHSNAHALCAVVAEPDGRATRRDPRLRAASSASTSRSRSCARTAARCRRRRSTEIVRHIDYFAERMGIDHVAFGSDFDGAVDPRGARRRRRAAEARRRAARRRLRRRRGREDHAPNWLRVLDATWRARPRYVVQDDVPGV